MTLEEVRSGARPKPLPVSPPWSPWESSKPRNTALREATDIVRQATARGQAAEGAAGRDAQA